MAQIENIPSKDELVKIVRSAVGKPFPESVTDEDIFQKLRKERINYYRDRDIFRAQCGWASRNYNPEEVYDIITKD